MDKEPFIIKSGKGHSVEIEQGSTHARRKRNVVAPQDDAPEDRVVGESLQEERKQADLSLQAEDPQPGPSPGSGQVLADSTARAEAGDEDVPAPADAAPGQAAVEVEAAMAAVAQDGPVIVLEARAEDDARAERADAASDRYLSGDESRDEQRDARAPKEAIVADRFASDSPGPEADEDLRGDAPPDQPLTNRQKVDNLQAQANRIQIEQAQAAPAELLLDPSVQDPARQETPDADPVQAAAPAVPQDDPPPVALPVVSEGLPPELEGNLGFTPAAPVDTPESGLLARVRALRSNMSVTDDRLTKLQGKPPIKP